MYEKSRWDFNNLPDDLFCAFFDSSFQWFDYAFNNRRKDRNEEIMRIDLSQDGDYDVDGTLGNVHISVKDGSVAVTQENSPNHYCSMQGYVDSVNTPIVCLPNDTVITIEGADEEEDTVIS